MSSVEDLAAGPLPSGDGSGPGEDAGWSLREVLERLDEEHRRFLAGAGRRLSELELEMARAKASSDEKARQVVVEAEAQATAIVQAAREECGRLRGQLLEEVQERAVVLLGGARKDSDALLAAAAADAERIRAEALAGADAALQAAQAKARGIVEEAQQEASQVRQQVARALAGPRHPSEHGADPWHEARTRLGGDHRDGDGAQRREPAPRSDELRLRDEMQALVDQMGQAFERLSGAMGAVAPGGPQAAAAAPEPAPPPPEASVPLIGSRGEQSPAAPEPSGAEVADPGLRPFRARPTPLPEAGTPEAISGELRSNGARRGWRIRDN